MSKALVIRGVDFSANKLDTVTLVNPVPCTGITLSESTKSMTSVGSAFTLTATAAPAYTTDSIIWSSSDTDIVSVANGVVTQTGIGTATVTATCGAFSASCVVTATNVLTFFADKTHAIKISGTPATYDYVRVYDANSTSYATLYNKEPSTPYVIMNDGVAAITYPIYPIRLGNGAAKIKITGVPSNVRVTCWQVDCDTESTYGAEHPSSAAAGTAKYISGDANSYDSNVPLGEDRTVNVSTGATAVVFAMQHNGAELTDSDISAITITITAS